MDHVVILNKKWGMLPKILDGRKTIESRWYLREKCPFNCVKPGDILYFKNSGEPISVNAKVLKVVQVGELNPDKVEKLLGKYGQNIGIERGDLNSYFEKFRDKKYALFVFVGDVKNISPFDINKSKAGFCLRAAWVTMDDIEKIKIK